MKTVYRASNTVEGHMIQGLLEQAGLNARVDGDYLQGGVGELAPDSLIRVRVDEDHYDRARAIIEEWDARQVADEEEYDRRTRRSTHPLFAALFGFVAGALLVTIIYQTPSSEQGTDYTGDGVPDTRRIHTGGRLSSVQRDRNFDGRIDSEERFDYREHIQSARHDNNFDGRFDTEETYRHGNPVSLASDTTGDGVMNYRREYRHGVLRRASLLDAQTGRPVRVKYFDGFRLLSADVDTSGDGRLDTRLRYDEHENVIAETAIR